MRIPKEIKRLEGINHIMQYSFATPFWKALPLVLLKSGFINPMQISAPDEMLEEALLVRLCDMFSSSDFRFMTKHMLLECICRKIYNLLAGGIIFCFSCQDRFILGKHSLTLRDVYTACMQRI